MLILFGRITVDCRENAYSVHSELSPSSGKSRFRGRIQTRKPKADSEYANDDKVKARKIANPAQQLHILCYLSLGRGKAYIVSTCPAKPGTKCPTGPRQPSFQVLNFSRSQSRTILSFFLLIISVFRPSYTASFSVGRCRDNSPKYTSPWFTSEVWMAPLVNTTSLFSHLPSGTSTNEPDCWKIINYIMLPGKFTS